MTPSKGGPKVEDSYVLEEQVGFLLRQVSQRHTLIFSELMNGDLTPMQFSALARLYDLGACSQNRLGRLTAMDAATVKGVIDRLKKRELVTTQSDPSDNRRLLVNLTDAGQDIIKSAILQAAEISHKTLAPLTTKERSSLIKTLKKLC